MNLGASRGESVLYGTLCTCISLLFLTPVLFKTPSAILRITKLCFHGRCGRCGEAERPPAGVCGCKSLIPSDPTKKPSINSRGTLLVCCTRASASAVGFAGSPSLKSGKDELTAEPGESRFCLFEPGSSTTECLKEFPSVLPIAWDEACRFSEWSGVVVARRVGGR
jgi:hypothetical protein